MKILIYTRKFLPEIGGVEMFVRLLAEGLAMRGGVEVTVVTATRAAPEFDRQWSFLVVRGARIWQLARLMRCADVVHLSGPAFVPLALSVLLGRRVVLEHHGFQAACPNGQMFYEPTQTPCPGHFLAGRHGECLRCSAGHSRWHSLRNLRLWLATFPRRWLCRCVAVNVMPTEWIESLLKLPRSRTILHGIQAQPVGSAPAHAPPTFVFQGRLVSTKGVDVLLRAALRLKQRGLVFRVCVVGDGPERSALEKQAQALGLAEEAVFTGTLHGEALEGTLRRAAAVVLPSLAGEVFGLVVAENMMRAKLVIVSSLGSLVEVLGDAGMVFAPGDAEQLASCLERVIREPQLAARLGQRARERAQRLFTWEPMVEQHLALYRTLLSA